MTKFTEKIRRAKGCFLEAQTRCDKGDSVTGFFCKRTGLASKNAVSELLKVEQDAVAELPRIKLDPLKSTEDILEEFRVKLTFHEQEAFRNIIEILSQSLNQIEGAVEQEYEQRDIVLKELSALDDREEAHYDIIDRAKKKLKNATTIDSIKELINQVYEAEISLESFTAELNSYPAKMYGQAAENFFNLMKRSYQFWGDGDDFNAFQAFYENQKAEFEKILIPDTNKAIDLFKEWIKDLRDQHLYVVFESGPNKSSKRNLGAQGREGYRTSSNFSLHNNEAALRAKHGFTKIDLSSEASSSTGNSTEQLFGHIALNNQGDKAFYMGSKKILAPPDTIPRSVVDFIKTADKNTYKGIVLDLRSNLGGYAHYKDNFVSHFIRESKIYGYKKPKAEGGNRAGDWEAIEFKYDPAVGTSSAPLLAELPLVILIDKYTASLGENVSAALRQRDKVLVVGERSRGAFSEADVSLNSDGSYGSGSEIGSMSNYSKRVNIQVIMSNAVCQYRENEVEKAGLMPDILVSNDDPLEAIRKAIEVINNGEAGRQIEKNARRPSS